MNEIKVKSPTRIDLAGGTLDMWPLFNFVGGAKTINVAIDIYTYCELTPRDDSKIILESLDYKRRVEFADLNSCLNEASGEWSLYQIQIRFWRPTRGFHLKTRSESPVGAGLGGSSSLVISLIKAFGNFCGRRFKDVHAMVQVAHNFEAAQLQTPTGTQDYYPAVTGGVSILDYGPEGVKQELLTSSLEVIRKSAMLAYTGKAHHSGLNNFEVLKQAVQKETQTLQALQDIKVIADDLATVLRQGQWNDIPNLFRREYEARIRLCEAFTSPEIEKLAQISVDAGAEAVKICGAGGGGCVLIWAPRIETQPLIRKACEDAGFTILKAQPVDRNEG